MHVDKNPCRKRDTQPTPLNISRLPALFPAKCIEVGVAKRVNGWGGRESWGRSPLGVALLWTFGDAHCPLRCPPPTEIDLSSHWLAASRSQGRSAKLPALPVSLLFSFRTAGGGEANFHSCGGTSRAEARTRRLDPGGAGGRLGESASSSLSSSPAYRKRPRHPARALGRPSLFREGGGVPPPTRPR